VAVVQHTVAIGASIAILAGLLRAYHDRAADRPERV
jgi:hypothetical protein